MRAKIGFALSSVVLLAAVAGLGLAHNSAHASVNVVGSGFTVTPGDLPFILKRIKIAEHRQPRDRPAAR